MSGAKDLKKVKPVPIELGGKQRTLLYDLNAFIELEEHYGSIDGAMEALEKGSIKALRAILWAGLLHEEEDLKPRDVGSWITINELPTFSEVLGKALSGALPQDDGTSPKVPLESSPTETERPSQ